MRYSTEEEIELTGEWLLRIQEAEVAKELLYVPSELFKIGVAPIDVVDWIDRNERPIPPVEEVGALVLDYDRYGAWEWAEPIERMMEEAFISIFDPEPDLPDFNELASLLRPQRRTKGKRARARSKPPPSERADKLVSENSARKIT